MPYVQKRRISVKRDKTEAARLHNDRYQHYYGDRRWKKLRDWFRKDHALCEDCLFDGRSVPGEEVHHRVPFLWFIDEKDKQNALLDPDNLVFLCKKCHMKRHQDLKKPENFEATEYYKKIHSMQ